jgi:hypothetical protein
MRFIEVTVEEHEELPDGCCLRFQAQGESRPIARVRYESEDGVAGEWRVAGARSDGSSQPAMGVLVDDSGAGTSMLIVGGDHGLRLTLDERTVAEPYLLLSPDAALG